MAITIVINPDLAVVLEKMATSGVMHPIARSSVFSGVPVLFEFSMGATGIVPTLRLIDADTHIWAYAAEPTSKFDDRSLG